VSNVPYRYSCVVRMHGRVLVACPDARLTPQCLLCCCVCCCRARAARLCPTR
jgi:hypothetical protein